MANATIRSARILALEHPISALEDRPALSAADLKAYFDGDPKQLMQAHNDLCDALTDGTAAQQIGFAPVSGIAASNLQEAVVQVQEQLHAVSMGTVPDASVSAEKLTDAVQQTLSAVPELQTAVSDLQQQTQRIRSYGAQFPLMVMAMQSDLTDTVRSALATAALGLPYEEYAHDIGEQLAWLCLTQGEALPSASFRSKQRYIDILQDSACKNELRSHDCLYTLLSQSPTALQMFRSM